MTPGADAPSVAAIVLAAGLSSRMAPHNKLLMRPISGRAMVSCVVAACDASVVSRVIVVIGHQSALVRAAVMEIGQANNIDFVTTPRFAEGLSASLRAGICAVPGGFDAAIVCLGDMPLLDPALLNRMIAAFDPSRRQCVVVPVWQGRRGNPVLWGRQFFPDICRLSGDVGARALLGRFEPLVTEVAAEDGGVLADFDTPAAFAGHAFAPAADGKMAIETS